MKMVIAIDPGASGGVAVFGRGKPFAYAMPDTSGDVLDLLRELHQSAVIEGLEPVCVLELVGGFVGKRQPGSAMFKFGEGFGFLKGVVQTLGLPLVLVRPQDWQKVYHLGTAASCGGGKVWKNKLKAEAQRRFPHLKVTLGTADALLLGAYHLNFPKQHNAAPCGDLASMLRQRMQPQRKPEASELTWASNQPTGRRGEFEPPHVGCYHQIIYETSLF